MQTNARAPRPCSALPEPHQTPDRLAYSCWLTRHSCTPYPQPLPPPHRRAAPTPCPAAALAACPAAAPRRRRRASPRRRSSSPSSATACGTWTRSPSRTRCASSTRRPVATRASADTKPEAAPPCIAAAAAVAACRRYAPPLSRCSAHTRWTALGSTETIWDNLNPKWSKTFDVRYYFEREQLFKFEVYDVDNESTRHNLAAQDFIGATAPLKLSEIVTAAGSKTFPLLARDGRALGHGVLDTKPTLMDVILLNDGFSTEK